MKWIVILLMCISFIGYSQNTEKTEKEEKKIRPIVHFSHHQNLVIGIGIRYGSNGLGSRVPLFKARSGESIVLNTKYGFNGVTLNYFHGIEGQQYQNIDLSLQASDIIMRGVGITWTQFEQATFWSIKPFIGLTHWNIEVYYAYYGIISKNKNLNRHSVNLGYRINF